MCYITTWFLFALLYFSNASLRGDLRQGQPPDDPLTSQRPCYLGVDGFILALLFSVEMQRTIGYGSRTVSPDCYEGVLLVMIQCVLGSMIDALMVGCMFVKISRPMKRAETLLLGCSAVLVLWPTVIPSRRPQRKPHGGCQSSCKVNQVPPNSGGRVLPLDQTEIDLGCETGSDRLFLVEPQVIQHNIDCNSPLWELGPEQLRRQQFEIIVILEGIVEATGE